MEYAPTGPGADGHWVRSASAGLCDSRQRRTPCSFCRLAWENRQHQSDESGIHLKYVSCFSGIGGLEANTPPELYCEIDPDMQQVLRGTHPEVPIWSDITTLKPPQADVLAGGWPCQDLSIAGNQAGLAGLRSGLLLDMLRVAKRARVHTVVAENVANLLRINGGKEFQYSLAEFHASEFPYIAWRMLNARSFGLPQHRMRLLIVASKSLEIATSLFRPLPVLSEKCTRSGVEKLAAGFYWTGGTHSINYSEGYVPTIKIGSSLGIASPPAVMFDGVVRQLSPDEALALQGFSLDPSLFASNTAIYRAAGNAVARPIGKWVMDGVQDPSVENPSFEWLPVQESLIPEFETKEWLKSGLSNRGKVRFVTFAGTSGALNLIDFLDTSNRNLLSPRASSGLMSRAKRSGQHVPTELRLLLEEIAATRPA